MLVKVKVENLLQKEILAMQLRGYEKRLLVSHWGNSSASDSYLDDFRRLSIEELRQVFFGDYLIIS